MPSYKDAIKWLAEEDDCDLNREGHALSVTGSMVADLWNKDCDTVAKDVCDYLANKDKEKTRDEMFPFASARRRTD